MSESRKCPECGAANRAHATWCQLCHSPLPAAAAASPTAERADSPAPVSPVESKGTTALVRSAGWTASLLLVVILATRVAAAFGGDALEGRVDARGFKFARVDADSGEPIRFDACSEIHYAINPDGAPEGAIEDIHTAIEMTSAASGVRFVYDGTTGEPLDLARESFQPDRYGDRWAPVLIGWMDELPVTGEPGSEGAERIGLGGSTLVEGGGRQPVLVTGVAFFDADADVLPGFGGETWGQAMLHELGHVMGLDHVSAEASIMNPQMGRRPAAWGTGDKAGLWELGIGSSCVRAPEPR